MPQQVRTVVSSITHGCAPPVAFDCSHPVQRGHVWGEIIVFGQCAHTNPVAFELTAVPLIDRGKQRRRDGYGLQCRDQHHGGSEFPQYCHLQDLKFNQLTTEIREEKDYLRGHTRLVWVQKRRDNFRINCVLIVNMTAIITGVVRVANKK